MKEFNNPLESFDLRVAFNSRIRQGNSSIVLIYLIFCLPVIVCSQNYCSSNIRLEAGGDLLDRNNIENGFSSPPAKYNRAAS